MPVLLRSHLKKHKHTGSVSHQEARRLGSPSVPKSLAREIYIVCESRRLAVS